MIEAIRRKIPVLEATSSARRTEDRCDAAPAAPPVRFVAECQACSDRSLQLLHRKRTVFGKIGRKAALGLAVG